MARDITPPAYRQPVRVLFSLTSMLVVGVILAMLAGGAAWMLGRAESSINRPDYIRYYTDDGHFSFDYPSASVQHDPSGTDCSLSYDATDRRNCEMYPMVSFDQSDASSRITPTNENMLSITLMQGPRYFDSIEEYYTGEAKNTRDYLTKVDEGRKSNNYADGSVEATRNWQEGYQTIAGKQMYVISYDDYSWLPRIYTAKEIYYANEDAHYNLSLHYETAASWPQKNADHVVQSIEVNP